MNGECFHEKHPNSLRLKQFHEQHRVRIKVLSIEHGDYPRKKTAFCMAAFSLDRMRMYSTVPTGRL